tara:strand:+ start:344 stop:688 length:345 start_codon:yes stop_codon:yes gene_type:complete
MVATQAVAVNVGNSNKQEGTINNEADASADSSSKGGSDDNNNTIWIVFGVAGGLAVLALVGYYIHKSQSAQLSGGATNVGATNVVETPTVVSPSVMERLPTVVSSNLSSSLSSF